MVVAAVDQRRRRAVVELQQRRAACLGRPRRIEHGGAARARCGPARRPSSRAVSIWCGTWLNRMPPPFDGVELLRPARAIEIVRVVEAVDQAEPAQLAARDDVAHQPHRRIEGVGVADDQMHLVPLDRRDDGVALGERQRHRLFQDDVLAVLGGEHARAARGTGAAWRCRPPATAGSAHQHPHVRIGPRVVVAGEGLARPRMRIGGGPQHEVRVGRGGVHHHGPGHAEAGDAEADRASNPRCSGVIAGSGSGRYF